ncbi:MAG: response regulator transcription factor [Candidatus Margulisbacteria bacterium]|nr:response regulator transcription factor [Candidatus Margulisiibacteriota bacterium]
MPEILIIEDDRDISESLEYNLKKEGYRPVKAHDGINGLRLIKDKHPALVILDLMLPGMDGLEICRQVRKTPEISSTPIIMLTAKGEETDKVVGLEVGADDYLTKPFSLKELMARIKTILRRSGQKVEAAKPRLKYKELEIDADRHEIKVSGKPIELTAKEFGLLQYLMENPGRVFSRETLLDKVWGIDVAIETRTVDVHMRRLREKLGKAGKRLITLRGVGYKFKE